MAIAILARPRHLGTEPGPQMSSGRGRGGAEATPSALARGAAAPGREFEGGARGPPSSPRSARAALVHRARGAPHGAPKKRTDPGSRRGVARSASRRPGPSAGVQGACPRHVQSEALYNVLYKEEMHLCFGGTYGPCREVPGRCPGRHARALCPHPGTRARLPPRQYRPRADEGGRWLPSKGLAFRWAWKALRADLSGG